MKPQNIEDIYQLTPTQQGILFHSLIAKKSGAYFVQNCLVIEGDLDCAAFTQAWQEVVNRHPALRSAFYFEGVEKPLQVVQKQSSISLIERDWRDKSSNEQKAALETYLQQDIDRGFDLTQAPLMRLALMRKSENSYQFIWSKHHLIIDGWSTGIVFKEVFAIYEKLRGKTAINLTTAPGYKNYVAWLQQQDLTQAESFWRENLRGFTAPTPLTVDRKAKSESESSYEEREIYLDRETTTALQSLARQHKVTLNTLFQGVWSLLLSRYSRSTDVVYGSTCSGRPAGLSGSESIVGVFINTIPVRVSVDPEIKLLPWLQQLQLQLAKVRQYEYSPLIQIQQWSEVPRGLPLFESLVVFENYPIDSSIKQRDTDWSIRDISSVDRTNYPLTVVAIPDSETAPGQFLIKIAYHRQRFDEEVIKRMLGHLENLLSSIADNPDRKLADLPLLTEPERNKILYEWNATETDYDLSCCLHQLVEAQINKSLDKIALRFEGQEITYRELNIRANQLAHYLQKQGVKPEVKVAICVERSLKMVIGLLGILKAGGAYVPLDPRLPQERWNYMLEDSQAKLILTQAKLGDRLPKDLHNIIYLDTNWSAEPDTNPVSEIMPDNMAYVIYTSGSTGKPKGVVNTHRGICNRLLWMQDRYQLNESDRILQKTPFSFDVSVWEFFLPLLTGTTLIIAKPEGHKDSAYLIDLIAKEKITTLHFVPSMLQIFLAEKDLDRCSSLRRVICSGEALPFKLQQSFFKRLKCQLHNLYGPTEAAIDVTAWQCQPESQLTTVPIGRAIANTQIYILDRNLQPVPVGVPGELHIGGVQVAREYLNRPELTAEKFIPNPFISRGEQPFAPTRLYKTGDLARYLPNGNIEYLGRIDYQVKIRGFRIELGEIEAVLLQHPAIREAVIIAREEANGERRLVAYFVACSAEIPTTSDLRQYLAKKLPEYEIPAVFMPLESLPLSANGKVDRRQLPAPMGDRLLSQVTYVVPKTELQQKIAVIWQEILGVEKVGIEDNFFDLGGNSLLMMRLYSQLREIITVDFPLLELFRHPTISALARRFSDDNSSPAKPNLERTERLEAGKTRLKQRLKQKMRANKS